MDFRPQRAIPGLPFKNYARTSLGPKYTGVSGQEAPLVAISHTSYLCSCSVLHLCISRPPRPVLCTNVYRNCMSSNSCKCQKSEHKQQQVSRSLSSQASYQRLPGNIALSWSQQGSSSPQGFSLVHWLRRTKKKKTLNLLGAVEWN